MSALFVVTIASIAIALAMSVVAWRMAREERRRSEARVQALAADIFDTAGDASSPVVMNDLFLADAVPETRTPWFAAPAIGALVVGTLIGITILFTRGSHDVEEFAPAVEAVPAAADETLELTELTHEREEGGLVIRGAVRGDAGAEPDQRLTAVVFALDGSGVVVGSGRAPVEIDPEHRAGGVESSFVVRINGVGEIRRYRVSFRRGDRTIAHVDRRPSAVTAQVP
jgi:hypothetical protein